MSLMFNLCIMIILSIPDIINTPDVTMKSCNTFLYRETPDIFSSSSSTSSLSASGVSNSNTNSNIFSSQITSTTNSIGTGIVSSSSIGDNNNNNITEMSTSSVPANNNIILYNKFVNNSTTQNFIAYINNAYSLINCY